MRKERNGNETKERVLAAAEGIFAARGFDGSSLAMVAEASGLSVGLILHHFKSKEGLYRELLARIASRYRATLSEAMGAVPKEDFEIASRRILESVFRFWRDDSVYRRISLWTYLEGREGLAEAESATSSGLAAMVRGLQGTGKADAGFEPYALLAMTIGPIHFWVQYRDSFKAQLGLAGGADELDEAFLDQYAGLVAKLFRPARDREGAEGIPRETRRET
jgi:AcrR family transcriptional regulator